MRTLIGQILYKVHSQLCRILTIVNGRRRVNRQRDEQSSLTRPCLHSLNDSHCTHPYRKHMCTAISPLKGCCEARTCLAFTGLPVKRIRKMGSSPVQYNCLFPSKLPGADTLWQLEASSPPDLPRIALVIELFSYSDQKRTLQN